MRDYKLRKKVANSYVSTSTLTSTLAGYAKSGTTVCAKLAADANAATIVTKVNALLDILAAQDVLKLS